MRILSKWVLPSLRLVLVAAVAVALTKLAFFSGAADAPTDAATPRGTLSEPVVAAATKTVVNDVSVSASVEADAPVAAKAPLAGTIGKLFVANGADVEAGAPLATIVAETPRDPLVGADGASVPQKPLIETTTITAPAAGVVAGLDLIAGQAVAIGDAVAQVRPPTFHLSGPLSVAQQYRLVSRPTEATVTVKGGPAPFTCTGLTIGSSDTTTAEGAPTPSSSAPLISCAVPGDVTVFAGLTARLTVPAGVAKDVVTVPLTAVEGSTTKGTVHLADKTGTATGTRAVTLGINDGTVVQVTGGLKAGETVLEFVPGAAAEQSGCTPADSVPADSSTSGVCD